MFQQLVASLALAKRIKARAPDVSIVFGGASCEGAMGREMARVFDCVDYVALGEADLMVADLVREARTRRHSPFAPVATKGVAYRDTHGGLCSTGNPPPVVHLDELPVPIFDDYFEQLEPQDLRHFEPFLYMEASRGCWWGQKHICTFCGLNGSTIAYRRKAPKRVVRELRDLYDRYRIKRFFMSDNILDHRAFSTFIPALRELRELEGYDFELFFELKSNVTREKVKLLKCAGVNWVQPGIESFSDNVLHLMSKGVSAIQQIQLLKFLAEFSIRADWNILYGNPGEKPDDYYEMTAVLPYLHHLPPPSEWSVLRTEVQRFNRYHQEPGTFGITALRPAAFYHDALPWSEIQLDEIAYHFEFDHPLQHDAKLAAAHRTFLDAVAMWRTCYLPDSLTYVIGDDGLVIRDRRTNAQGLRGEEIELTLSPLQSRMYMACESARHEASLFAMFTDLVKPATTERFVHMMVERRLMYRSAQGMVLSLALAREEQAHPREEPANAALEWAIP